MAATSEATRKPFLGRSTTKCETRTPFGEKFGARGGFHTREIASWPLTARPAPRGGARSRACTGSGARGRARARARDSRKNAYLGTQVARVGEPRLLQAVTAVHGVKSGPARAAKLRERGVAPTQTSPALVARPRRGLFPHDVRRRRRDVLAYRDRGRCRHAARLTRDVGTRRLWASGVALYGYRRRGERVVVQVS